MPSGIYLRNGLIPKPMQAPLKALLWNSSNARKFSKIEGLDLFLWLSRQVGYVCTIILQYWIVSQNCCIFSWEYVDGCLVFLFNIFFTANKEIRKRLLVLYPKMLNSYQYVVINIIKITHQQIIIHFVNTECEII